jgi:uncharacterized membrane protein YvbJ
MAPNVCPKCGSPNMSASKFCARCGSPLAGARAAGQEQERPPVPVTALL